MARLITHQIEAQEAISYFTAVAIKSITKHRVKENLDNWGEVLDFKDRMERRCFLLVEVTKHVLRNDRTRQQTVTYSYTGTGWEVVSKSEITEG